VEVSFTDEELRRLDEVSKLPLEYPGWMLDFTGYDRLEQWPPPERTMPENS
jgi:hypothetical protein